MTYLDKRERTMSRQFKCKDPNISRLENWTVLTNIHQRCLNLVRDGASAGFDGRVLTKTRENILNLKKLLGKFQQ